MINSFNIPNIKVLKRHEPNTSALKMNQPKIAQDLNVLRK